jgi:mono/diheme cytochrome c family protein
MVNPHKHSGTKRLALSLALVAGLGGCGSALDGGALDDDARKVDDTSTELSGDSWTVVRAARQKALDKYLTDHAGEFAAFRDGALGTLGTPKLLFDKFPLIAPDIWGAPSDFMAPVGFSKNPFAPEGSLPLGLSKTIDPSTGLEVVSLSCGGCHMGKVKGADGAVRHLVGSGNGQFNQFRVAIVKTASDPRFDAAFANTPLAPLASAFKAKVLQSRDLINATLGGFTYNPLRFPNAPDINAMDKPGYLDAIGIALVTLVVPDIQAGNFSTIPLVLPPAPAQVDIPSVWREAARDVAQWDGSIPSAVHRNLAAEIGVMQVPSVVSFANAKATADFVANLPPAPYPFDVNIDKAQQGEALFRKYCSSCHQDEGTQRFSAIDVGTDPNRTITITTEGRARLLPLLKATCTDPAVCDLPDEEILQPVENIRGYMAAPLDGIWARAPYLHNGSVPNLRTLLVPATRPATFARGSLRYDTKNVGFASDATALAEPNTHAFDTTEAGASNTGHSSLKFNGIDWSKNTKALDALLEYMKTL